jgi:hypothetical protein
MVNLPRWSDKLRRAVLMSGNVQRDAPMAWMGAHLARRV